MNDAWRTAGGGLGQKAADVLSAELRNLMAAIGERVVEAVANRVGVLTDRLTDVAAHGGNPGQLAMAVGAQKLAHGESPLRAALSGGVAGGKQKLKQLFGTAGKAGKGKIKVTNIVETVDVGVPVRVAYDQWTRFTEFPSFLKKVENVDQESDEKMTWKAQIFWSHRTWEATIIEQVPDRHIIWRSKGEKGSVDGTVSFHELAPDLTRILVVLQYHPQGLFEKTGNIWRAQGRRARLELKHFVRHVMSQTILEQDQLTGWRGEIRDGQVVRDHETALEEENRLRDADDVEGDSDDRYDDADDVEGDGDDRRDERDGRGEPWDEEPEEQEPEPQERRVPRARRPGTRPARAAATRRGDDAR